MKKIARLTWLTTQIGIIVFAVLITFFRLGIDSVQNYEMLVESWFESQGINAEIDHLAFRVDGFTPELFVAGLVIKDEKGKELLALEKAFLTLDLVDTVWRQTLVVKKASFVFSKINADIAQVTGAFSSNNSSLPQGLIDSLLALDQATLEIKQLVYGNKKQQQKILYNSKIELFDSELGAQVYISSALFQQKNILLKSHFNVDVGLFLHHSQLKGSGFIALDLPSIERAKWFKNASVKGDVELKSWLKFDGPKTTVQSYIKSDGLSVKVKNKDYTVRADSFLWADIEEDKLSLTIKNNILNINDNRLNNLEWISSATIKSGTLMDNLIHVENIEVPALQRLLADIPKMKGKLRFIQKLNPSGLIEEAFVSLKDIKQSETLQFSIKAKQLKWDVVGEIPSVNSVNVDLVGNPQHFSAAVKNEAVDVLLNEFYTAPFTVQSVNMQINGQFNDAGMIIDIPKILAQQNKASINARAKLILENGSSPYLFLRVDGNNADIQTVKPFLPQKLMDSDVLQWIEQSIHQAQVENVDVLYAGRLENEVDFNKLNNGTFIADLNLRNVALTYDPEWPKVEAQQAQLIFENLKLSVLSDAAITDDIKVENVDFSIPDLFKARAYLALNVTEDLNKEWSFYAKTPLKDVIPYFDDITDLSGSVSSTIKASFSLDTLDDAPILFDISLDANNAGFAIGSLGIQLSELNGLILFSQDSLSIKPLTAQWFGQPIRLTASTQKNKLIHLNVKAESLDVASLLHSLPTSFNRHASGKSAWDIDVIFNPNLEDLPTVKVSAHSKLVGTKINLPSPFTTQDVNDFSISASFYKNQSIKITSSLNDQFQILSRFNLLSDGKYGLFGANLSFDKGAVTSKVTKGIRVDGNITALNVDHWRSYFEADGEGMTQNSLSDIDSIDLTIDSLQLIGIESKNTHLKVNGFGTGLSGTIQSSVAKGSFYVPINLPPVVPIVLDMDIVDVSVSKQKGALKKSIYKTEDFPSFIFSSKQFAINGYHFKDAKLNIETHEENKFLLKTLAVSNNDITLSASGAWVYHAENDQHDSNLFIDVNGKNLGKSLLELGIGDAIDKGNISVSGEMFWTSSFWTLDFDKAHGKVDFLLEDGYLKDVEPGGGRFIGLLSLSALPRRLGLDFSDFFKEGLAFDEMKGSFSLHDGSLWTEDFKMKGPASDVKIIGRTGIKAKDYDQTMIIIPQIRDTLPVISSLVAGSSVGWAVLLFQRLFKDPIDESVSIKYKVSGTWDEPKIDLIEEPKENLNEEINEEYL